MFGIDRRGRFKEVENLIRNFRLIERNVEDKNSLLHGEYLSNRWKFRLQGKKGDVGERCLRGKGKDCFCTSTARSRFV